ncbi:MAG TPA: DUF2283 domain-containing protein [Chloroflexota bacterium]
MRITYDPEADVLGITWRDGTPASGREVAPDLVVECDPAGQPIYLELLNASKHVEDDPLSVGLELLAPDAVRGGRK